MNITQPEEDITSRPQGAGSNTLTTGAIVGIAVGCALLFIGAGVLIFIHCRRQRRNAREKIDSPPPETPGRPKFIGSSLPTKQKMSESISSFKNHPDMSHKRAYSTNATYYDSLRPELGGQGLGLSYPYNPQSKSNGSFGIMPSHPAYDPRVMSRNSERSRSPPKHPLGKLTDSYALRTYLNAPEPTNPANPSDPGRRIAGHHGRSFSQPMRQPPRPPATAMVGIPPPPPPKQHRPKVPSLVLPSLSKAKRSKTYEPPQVITTDQEEAPYVTTSQDH